MSELLHWRGPWGREDPGSGWGQRARVGEPVLPEPRVRPSPRGLLGGCFAIPIAAPTRLVGMWEWVFVGALEAQDCFVGGGM